MIFLYIWQQNAIIQQQYQKQYLERKLLEIKKETQKIRELIAEKTTPDTLLTKAKNLGLQKTPPDHLIGISKLQKESDAAL